LNTPEVPEAPQWHLEDKDVRIKYHPHANRPDQTFRFGEYLTHVEEVYDRIDVDPPASTEPWRPFRTLLDFEIAELVQDTNMTRRQKSALIRLFQRCIKDPELFTLIDEPDLTKTWEDARRVHMSSVRYISSMSCHVPRPYLPNAFCV
jgi:hypothetical protein